MISEDILNFLAFQLLHGFDETCLVCSPMMKKQELRKNFISFGSSNVFLFRYH